MICIGEINTEQVPRDGEQAPSNQQTKGKQYPKNEKPKEKQTPWDEEKQVTKDRNGIYNIL